jgi:hypothetical protein
MKHNTFHHLSATVGTNGTLTLPLCDASTGGSPIIVVGPAYRRNPARYFASMPNIEEAEKLPTPLGYDKKSVSFQPTIVILDGPLSPHCTVQFVRVICGNERGKITKRALHSWTPLNDTSIYPSAAIQISPLKPGDTLELEGVGYWIRTQYGENRKRNAYRLPSISEPPPQVRTRHVVHLQVLIKMSWLPIQQGRGVRVVNGSPLDWPRSPDPLDSTPAQQQQFQVPPPKKNL